MKRFSKRILALSLLSLLFFQIWAQQAEKHWKTRGGELEIVYKEATDSTVKVVSVKNHYGAMLVIKLDSEEVSIAAGNPPYRIEKVCREQVTAGLPNGPQTLWVKKPKSAKEFRKTAAEKPKSAAKSEEEAPAILADTQVVKKTVGRKAYSHAVSTSRIAMIFRGTLEKDAFYSSAFAQAFHDEVGKHVELMNYMTDPGQREEYIRKHQLREYLRDREVEIKSREDGMESYIGNFIISNFSAGELPQRSEYETELRNILEQRISERRDILDNFRNAVQSDDFSALVAKHLFSGESIAINAVVALLVVCLVAVVAIAIRKTKRKSRRSTSASQVGRLGKNVGTDIVVRRKTTSILKRQSLEDVQNNGAYFPIDCADFCPDSAVRRIYLKNTCIKDIYNLYAEDLRNPETPNEDGCMVLGRWVHDEESDEYYVSLEEIVKPGDDAVFKEYELNFGGKIKLKVSERLRRLRRETNLQYDMTCWVHSHPGLGVFFSNADSSVQMQLKHPTHPKFLIAMVVDILTPTQELGIFTFKHDLTINSKSDLQKMYSLEALHKWAVESDRASFKPEEHFNIMQTAAKRMGSHYGIELPNSAIIDICQLQARRESGLLAWVYGYACERNGKTEYVLNSVAETKHLTDDELLGCYVNGAHCSIPTIKRFVSNDFSNIKFILFYSTSEDVLTSIPVVGGQISMDEACYGENKLEDLKIWTRRKR